MTALNVAQGSLDPAIPVYNRSSSFAATDSDLDLVFVGGSTPVFVSASNPTGNVDLIRWQIDKDLSETDRAIPILTSSSGQQVSFPVSIAGNFRLTAYVDLNGNQTFDEGEQLFIVRFAIVQVSLLGTENFRTGLLFMRTGQIDPPVSGMSLDALYLLAGGGSQQMIGTSAIKIGDIGNLIDDTFQVDYPATDRNNTPGTGREYPGGSTPMLDISKLSYSPGGAGPFRGNSVCTVVNGSPRGVSVRLSSRDNPQFRWADPHPVTGNPAGPITGGNSFREYVVAFSSFFPNAYAPLYQADWRATACSGDRAAIAPSTVVAPAIQPKVDGSSFAATMRYTPPGIGSSTGRCPSGPIPSTQTIEFALGQAVGDSFASECQVVYGELLTYSPTFGQPVEVRVTRAFVGKFSPGQTIRIPYASPGTSPKAGDTLAHAWDRVKFSRRVPVMAILTPRQMGIRRPCDPVLVTSRARDFEIILSLVEEATRLAASPEDIWKRVGVAVSTQDSALAGYLCAHIWHHEAVSNPQFSSELLSKMVGSPSVPPEAWSELAEDIVLSYVLLTGPTQASIVDRFVALAQRPDPNAGLAGFRGLGKIAGFSPLDVPTGSVTGLMSAYRRLVKYDGIPREGALELALSFVLD